MRLPGLDLLHRCDSWCAGLYGCFDAGRAFATVELASAGLGSLVRWTQSESLRAAELEILHSDDARRR